VKFYLQNFCAVIISHRTKNNGLDGLSLHDVSPVFNKGAEWLMVLIKVLSRGAPIFRIPPGSQVQPGPKLVAPPVMMRVFPAIFMRNTS
jgi:hypothetical protein